MRKTILKLSGILLMVTALVLTQVPALGTSASSPVNNGFMMDGTKLVKYTGTATAVSVPNGVKTIGAEAFAENIGLASITFPNSMETIESGAFGGCVQLRRLELPEGCKTIENGAFADCDRLEYVKLPASLISMGTSVFAGCDKLSGVSIDSRNQYFYCKDGVIYDYKTSVIYQFLAGNQATAYNMPNTIKEIKKYAFWGCSNLKDVNISSQLTEVGDYAFSNASGLENITLPYSVRAIRRKAFEDCVNLTNVTIPISVTTIDDTAFDGCSRLKIKAEKGSKAEEYYQKLEADKAANEEYEDSLSSGGVNSHWKDDQTESTGTTPSSAKIPYASDVDHYVEWDVDSPGVLGRTKVVSGQAVILFSAGDSEIHGGESSEADGFTVDDETVQQAITDDNAIGYKAFYSDPELSHIRIPDSVRTIGSFAFARSGLKDIEIPLGVDTIENAAFYHCDNLKKVVIPNSVREIGEDAFSKTLWLDNWFSGSDIDDFLIVGDGILLAYKGNNSKVSVPVGVRQIGAGAFRDHTEILQADIPDSVVKVCEDAFYGCSSLKTVTGMNAVEEIGDRAFYRCPVSTIRIPASVKEIGVSAFGGTDMTDSVIFLGTKLPKLSYNDSSTRLSAERKLAFDGISAIVIDASLNPDAFGDTVLDSGVSGYNGIVYHISTGEEAKTAIPIASSYSEADTAYPDTVYVYGRAYRVNASSSVAFHESEPEPEDVSLQGLLVVDHSELKKADVSLSQSGSTQNLNGYRFYVSDAGAGKKDLTQAVQESFGATDDSNSFYFDLSMYDPTDRIPIQYLGKNKLNVTIPVPTQLIGKEICAITLDRNKKPEILFGTLTVKDNRQYVSFDVSHFSPYMLYAPEGELKNRITQKWDNASGNAGLDITPDTGDYLDIRPILFIGLFALGGFLLLLGCKDIRFAKRDKK